MGYVHHDTASQHIEAAIRVQLIALRKRPILGGIGHTGLARVLMCLCFDGS